METKVYKGIIKEDDYVENSRALFVGEYSYPIAEIFEGFENKQVSVRYWVSDKEKTKEELKKSFIRKLFGDVSANYSDAYSEYTGYLWTNEELKIGGHDLLEEIRSCLGMYIYLEIDVHKDMNPKEKVINILKEHNIRIEISGCGCCGSPWVTFEYNGEKIVDDELEFNINMFEETEQPKP